MKFASNDPFKRIVDLQLVLTDLHSVFFSILCKSVGTSNWRLTIPLVIVSLYIDFRGVFYASVRLLKYYHVISAIASLTVFPMFCFTASLKLTYSCFCLSALHYICMSHAVYRVHEPAVSLRQRQKYSTLFFSSSGGTSSQNRNGLKASVSLCDSYDWLGQFDWLLWKCSRLKMWGCSVRRGNMYV